MVIFLSSLFHCVWYGMFQLKPVWWDENISLLLGAKGTFFSEVPVKPLRCLFVLFWIAVKKQDISSLVTMSRCEYATCRNKSKGKYCYKIPLFFSRMLCRFGKFWFSHSSREFSTCVFDIPNTKHEDLTEQLDLEISFDISRAFLGSWHKSLGSLETADSKWEI